MYKEKKVKDYKVYEHVFPNGKRYIGITCYKNVQQRWKNGKGYNKEDQPVMYNAIQKYGWNNIEHNIIATGLTHDQACELEKELIAKYNANCHKGNGGYNMTDGGEGSHGHIVSSESRIKMSMCHKGKTGAMCHNSKPVYCDGIVYDSLTEFISKHKIKGAVKAWMTGEKAMPKEWYDKKLHYVGSDFSKLKCQEKPHSNEICFDGKIYKSQAQLAKALGVTPSTLCLWLKGKANMPDEYKNKIHIISN